MKTHLENPSMANVPASACVSVRLNRSNASSPPPSALLPPPVLPPPGNSAKSLRAEVAALRKELQDKSRDIKATAADMLKESKATLVPKPAAVIEVVACPTSAPLIPSLTLTPDTTWTRRPCPSTGEWRA